MHLLVANFITQEPEDGSFWLLTFDYTCKYHSSCSSTFSHLAIKDTCRVRSLFPHHIQNIVKVGFFWCLFIDDRCSRKTQLNQDRIVIALQFIGNLEIRGFNYNFSVPTETLRIRGFLSLVHTIHLESPTHRHFLKELYILCWFCHPGALRMYRDST